MHLLSKYIIHLNTAFRVSRFCSNTTCASIRIAFTCLLRPLPAPSSQLPAPRSTEYRERIAKGRGDEGEGGAEPRSIRAQGDAGRSSRQADIPQSITERTVLHCYANQPPRWMIHATTTCDTWKAISSDEEAHETAH